MNISKMIEALEANAGTKKVLDALTELVTEFVTETEARTPTTRGHYGVYMGALSEMPKDRPEVTKLVGGECAMRILSACALVKAGANRRGVEDAMRIIQP